MVEYSKRMQLSLMRGNKKYAYLNLIITLITIIFVAPLMILATIIHCLGYGEAIWLRKGEVTHKVKHWSLIRKAKEGDKYVWS